MAIPMNRTSSSQGKKPSHQRKLLDSALGSISINLARAVGPAIAGLLIARAGVGAVFALNTATLLLYGLVVAAWRPRPGRSPVA
jgi:predicted MFS family arabinose efflux permease